jgi:hypothetical protein
MSKFALDLAERTVASYLFAFVTLLLASSTGVLTVPILTAAAVAAVPAALEVIKGALAKFVGDPGSAGLTQ